MHDSLKPASPWCLRTLLFLGLCSALAAGDEPRFPAWQRPEGVAAVPLSGPLAFGHSRLEGRAIACAWLQVAGPLQGHYLRGGIRLVYRAEDASEAARLRTNLRRHGLGSALMDAGRAGEIALDLEEAVVWSTGLEGLPVGQGAAGPLKAVPELQQAFRFPQRSAPIHAVLQAAVEGGKAVLLWGRKGATRVQLLFDPHTERVEELSLLVPSPDFRPERTQVAVVSRQALGWDWKTPPGPTQLQTRLDLDFVGQGKEDVDLRVRTTVEARIKPSRMLRFQLLNTLLVDDGRPGMAQVPIQVDGVQAGGQNLPFQHGSEELLVMLPAPLEPGKAVELDIRIRAPFRRRIAGARAWELHAQAWYPQCLGPAQGHTTRIRMSLPAEEVPIAPGRTLKRAAADGRCTVETELPNPVKDLVLAGGSFTNEPVTRNGLTVNHWSTRGHGTWSATTQRRTLAYLQFFGQLHGVSPFPEVHLVERDLPTIAPPLPGWVWIAPRMPNPTIPVGRQGDVGVMPLAMHIGWTGRNVLPALAPAPDGSSPLVEDKVPDPAALARIQGHPKAQALVEHGLAYQAARLFYGQLLKPLSYEDVWLLESLAAYLGNRALPLVAREGQGMSRFMSAVWEDEAKRTAALASPLHALDLVSNRTGEQEDGPALLYGKGTVVLEELVRTVSEATFLSALRVLTRPSNWAWKPVGTHDLVRVLGALTGQAPTALFDAYVRGTALPVQTKRP